MATFNIAERNLNAANSPIFSQSVNVPQAGRDVHMRLVAADWLTPAYATLDGVLTIQDSFDNGANWRDVASTPFTGGDVTPPKFGQPGGLLPDLAATLVAGQNHQARLKIEINQNTSLGLTVDVN